MTFSFKFKFAVLSLTCLLSTSALADTFHQSLTAELKSELESIKQESRLTASEKLLSILGFSGSTKSENLDQRARNLVARYQSEVPFYFKESDFSSCNPKNLYKALKDSDISTLEKAKTSEILKFCLENT